MPAEDIVAAARRFGSHASARWRCGRWASTSRRVGTLKNRALINLCLATGNIGRPGSGPAVADRPAERDGRARDRRAREPAARLPQGHRAPRTAPRMRRFWNSPGIAPEPGLAATELVEALEERPDQGAVDRRHQPGRLPARRRAASRRRCKRADLVICQDAYFPTETARARARAPARRAVAGEGRDDDELRAPRVASSSARSTRPARRCRTGRSSPASAARSATARRSRGAPRPPCTPSTCRLTEGRLCDQTGISHARLQRDGPLQWPCPSADAPRHRAPLRRRAASRTPDGRARLAPTPAHRARRRGHARLPAHAHHRPRRAAVAHDDPHGQVAVAAGGRAAPVPRAAPRRRGQLRPTARRCACARGAARPPCALRHHRRACRPGVAFAPFHWGALHLEAGAGALNTVTSRAVDPTSHAAGAEGLRGPRRADPRRRARRAAGAGS